MQVSCSRKEFLKNTMGSSYHLYSCIHFLFAAFFFHLLIITNSSYVQPIYHDHERSALLHFKRSFSIRENIFGNPAAYSKLDSWRLKGNTSDCCTWDGVECDENSGHVIGLDLSSSLLYGSINSNSSLFRLVHLQRLNLADNDFNHSPVPFGISRLSHLTSLNLSRSAFSGQIPQEISHLSKLLSLDLSDNVKFWSSENLRIHDALGDVYPQRSNGLLTLDKSTFRNFALNLSSLKILHLQMVNIYSTVPDILSNMSSLIDLVLKNCGLYGIVPVTIFQLPNMVSLSLGYNDNLSGHLPDSIGNLSSLKALDLEGCHFIGSFPPSLGNLTQLTHLNLFGNDFEGHVPSLGSLKQLDLLFLGYNRFNLRSLDWVGLLTKLTQLDLFQTGLNGEIPLSFANHSLLTWLNLGGNNLYGQIPSWLGNLTRLAMLNLQLNKFQGPIPSSLFKLENLNILTLADNNLIGKVAFDNFLKIKSLSHFSISRNELTVLTNNITNITLPVFRMLGLATCNLMSFPNFLRSQDQLEALDLGTNKIHGQIPLWMLNTSRDTLNFLYLQHNFITGFEGNPINLPWSNLRILHIQFNMFQGQMPIPPPSTLEYMASNNLLTGKIPTLLCQRNNLFTLDLSNNNLSGIIPPCLGNFSNLSVLNLHGNHFHGKLAETFSSGCKLTFIDLSENQLQGHIPRSLANCTLLEILLLGNNEINDTFPFWLGDLSELQVLILRSNKFHGEIVMQTTNSKFPKLRIIDLFDNDFTGQLPVQYFQGWNAMKIIDEKWLAYMEANITIPLNDTRVNVNYMYSLTMTNKGVKTVYEKILNIFVAVDLSSNKFTGEIPELIGSLKALQLLNLSNNYLSGGIPQSMGSLSNLESLDLSQNNLSGGIPQQFQQLNFLAFLNVSHNHLFGSIPQGKQFDTFQNNSYEGNPGLCGTPLSKKCGNSEAQPPLISPSEQTEESKFTENFEWVFISLGYGSGLVVGVVIGNIVFMSYRGWFLEKFGIRQHKRRPRRRRQRQSTIVV